MEAATIKLFLVHGTPNGLRTGELSNWSGKAVAGPRTEFSALLSREELNNPGIYFLTGTDSVTGVNAVYVGEAENVANRLKKHTDKDFWNNVTIFVSKDENLTKSHIRFLEGRLISLLNSQSTSVVMNSAGSGAKLPEADTAEMEIYLTRMLQLLPVLGVTSFNQSVETKKDAHDVLYCKIKMLTAIGNRTSGGFTVYEGSQAVAEHRPSATHAKIRREDLIARGLLVKEGGHLRFTKDIEFGSPSTAGAVVRGGASNGLTVWKNEKGVKLKELEDGGA
jgi:hypothetical protein